MAKKRKGALKDIEDFKLSNPDSKGVNASVLEKTLPDRKTCNISTYYIKDKTKANTIIRI